MNKAELRALLLQKRAKKAQGTATLNDLAAAISALSAPEKATLTSKMRENNGTELGAIVLDALRRKLSADAAAAVDAALADDSLTMAELEALT